MSTLWLTTTLFGCTWASPTDFEPIHRTVHLGGQPVRVHALPTGTVQIKRCHHTGCLPEATPGPLRFAAILSDIRLAPPMPIWTYLIEHPEGLVLIDAGGNRAFSDPESWRADPITGRLIRSFIRLNVPEGAEVHERMEALGLAPTDVAHLVLTHQHVDHTAGVPQFSNATVWTTRAEQAAQGQIGSVPWRWEPPATRLRFVDEEGTPGIFSHERSLGRGLVVAHTPGHTPGSVTVRLEADEGTLWFTGDTTFTNNLDPSAPTAGIHSNMAAVRALQSLTLGGLVLPSHDADLPGRWAAWGNP